MAEQPTKKASVLVEDLNNIPNIVSSMGLGIAAAQRAFNLDYLESLERLFALAKMMSSAEAGDLKDIFQDIVKAMAPSRYQFTETTISVRMDLAQSMQEGASATLGASVGAVALNASYTRGFAYDYGAAAEVKTVIDAIPFDPAVMSELLLKAEKFSAKKLDLTRQSEVDVAFMEKSKELLDNAGLTPKEEPAKPEDPGTGTDDTEQGDSE